MERTVALSAFRSFKQTKWRTYGERPLRLAADQYLANRANGPKWSFVTPAATLRLELVFPGATDHGLKAAHFGN
ncbi:hypothetical protein NBRC116597_30910 [Phaeobacter sp. NW0010-22]